MASVNTVPNYMTSLGVINTLQREDDFRLFRYSLRLNIEIKYLSLEKVAELTRSLASNEISSSIDLNEYKWDFLGHYEDRTTYDEHITTNCNSIITSLKTNTTVKSILLAGCSIGNDGAFLISDSLIKNTTLKNFKLFDYTIEEEGVDRIINALSHNKTLTSIVLGRLSFSTNDIMRLATLPIKSLNLPKCDIRGDLAIKLAEGLKINSTLTELDLSHNPLENEIGHLAESLSVNSTLEWLNLSHCNINSEQGLILPKILAFNTTLQTLWLTKNPIGLQVGSSLIKNCTNLTELGLNLIKSNKDTNYDKKTLAKALATNSSLSYLGLNGNMLGNDEAQLIAEVLKKNTTLSDLNLRSNHIGSEGLLHIVNALSFNTTLKKIDIDQGRLQENRIRNEVLDGVLQRLEFNPSIESLWFDFRYNSNKEKIVPFLLRNKHNNTQRISTLFDMLLKTGILATE